MRTLNDRLFIEQVHTVENKLNEASDEDILRDVQAKINRLERVSKNILQIKSLKLVIDSVKEEVLSYADKGRFKRAFSKNVFNKVDKLIDGLTSLMTLVRQLGNVAPDLADGESHSGKMKSMIDKGISRVKADFLKGDVLESVKATLMVLSPKQLKSFGQRPLSLTPAQQSAVGNDQPEDDASTPEATGEPKDTNEPAKSGSGDDNSLNSDDKDASKEQRDSVKSDILKLVAEWNNGEGRLSFNDFIAKLKALADNDEAAQPAEQQAQRNVQKKTQQAATASADVGEQ